MLMVLGTECSFSLCHNNAKLEMSVINANMLNLEATNKEATLEADISKVIQEADINKAVQEADINKDLLQSTKLLLSNIVLDLLKSKVKDVDSKVAQPALQVRPGNQAFQEKMEFQGKTANQETPALVKLATMVVDKDASSVQQELQDQVANQEVPAKQDHPEMTVNQAKKETAVTLAHLDPPVMPAHLETMEHLVNLANPEPQELAHHPNQDQRDHQGQRDNPVNQDSQEEAMEDHNQANLDQPAHLGALDKTVNPDHQDSPDLKVNTVEIPNTAHVRLVADHPQLAAEANLITKEDKKLEDIVAGDRKSVV